MTETRIVRRPASFPINQDARAAAKGQQPCVIWFTGLSAAGKSTIANAVEGRLHERGCHTYLLDGDNVRQGLNKDLGFTDEDRVENIRRVAEVARLMVDAGLIVIVAFISPFESDRRMARHLVGENEFFEIFVDAPLELAERRTRRASIAWRGAAPSRTSPASTRPTRRPRAPTFASTPPRFRLRMEQMP